MDKALYELPDRCAGKRWQSVANKSFVKDIDSFYERLEGLTKVILENNYISDYTYTRRTDVEHEKNGIYFFDRTPKFDMKKSMVYSGKQIKILRKIK